MAVVLLQHLRTGFRRQAKRRHKRCISVILVRARRGYSSPTRVVGLSSLPSKLIGHLHRGQLAVVFSSIATLAPICLAS